MNIFTYLVSFLMLTLALMTDYSGESDSEWYKGNLHTHSYWSDGDDYPEKIMQWYKNHGYDFVALSDHNILQEGEKWIEVKKGTRYGTTFRQYLESFGENWVEYEEFGQHYRVKLKTLAEYRPLFEIDGEFLIINSEEITDGFGEEAVHLNATNLQELIEPRGGNSVAEVMQNNIDAVLKQREATGEPILPHINHPNFRWSITAEDLKKLEGERFFEVYNGHPLVNNYGDSLRSGTEQIWDEVITHYLLEGKPAMYGLAVDDAHNYHQIDSNRANPGRGWICVKSRELTPDALIAAMERGDFYASTGVRLSEIRFDGNRLTVSVDAEEGVDYTTRFMGTVRDSVQQTGVLLNEVDGPEASYQFRGNEMYVRAKVISDREKENPYAEGEVEVAWTQPVTAPDNDR